MVTTIFTDGACVGNPGPGGWAVLLTQGDREKVLTGTERDTKNGRMELLAVVMGVEALKEGRTAELWSDCRYVVDGWNVHLTGWKARGWRKANRQPVAHQDLWERLEVAMASRKVTIGWVKGHASSAENNRVDRLAEAAARSLAAEIGWSPADKFGF